MSAFTGPLLIVLALVGSLAACGGGGSPSPVKVAPAVTSPASPLPSPGSTYDSGY